MPQLCLKYEISAQIKRPEMLLLRQVSQSIAVDNFVRKFHNR